ncbi:hypothetical protein [Actinoplanes siamensis]|uniref:Uncharacterized protein n=1 Tax=Actinoplanes siamensis TaxID=1223317 RepID=A0A919ND81_9ACTN|nr:hypothetical protein [Actinoplanes siamensis]GIF08672.1 hypothetical protein Asi03nite_62100 [Actinoplanes siamensis]
MFDRIVRTALRVRRIGGYEVRPSLDWRALGFLLRWGNLRPGRVFSAQLGPLVIWVEPLDGTTD